MFWVLKRTVSKRRTLSTHNICLVEKSELFFCYTLLTKSLELLILFLSEYNRAIKRIFLIIENMQNSLHAYKKVGIIDKFQAKI